MFSLRAMSAGLSAAFVFLAGGCLSPTFAELGPEACRDMRDNDGDGDVDCDDGDCTNSGACEQHASTCSDGVDNDGDELVDCADEGCEGNRVCVAAPARCNPLTSAGAPSKTTPCPHGMACYVRSDATTECRAPGTSGPGTPCTIDGEPSARAPCAPGLGCQVSAGASQGLCSPYCDSDDVCIEQRGQCLGMGPGAFGICSVGCTEGVLGSTSELACPPEFTCVTGQNLGISGAAGGYDLRCTHAQSYVPGLIADADTRCTDPGPDGEIPAPNERCADTRVCYGPSFEQLRCREPCALAPSSPGACAGECARLSPPNTGAAESPAGVCLPTP